MDQNKSECLRCMEQIKRRLDNLGLSTIMTSNKENILCKSTGEESLNSTKSISTTNLASKCPSMTVDGKCPHTSCKYPNASCHIHNTGNMSGSNDTTLLPSVLETCGCSLFRIMPTDIHSGIFLHVIKLHGEMCELKMTFDYTDTGVTELVNIIKFLVE